MQAFTATVPPRPTSTGPNRMPILTVLLSVALSVLVPASVDAGGGAASARLATAETTPPPAPSQQPTPPGERSPRSQEGSGSEAPAPQSDRSPAQGTAQSPEAGISAAAADLPEATWPGLHPVRVEAFVDGLVAAYREAFPTAGATVSVVQHGRLLVAKGYGWADVEARRPIDPARTLFRIGSISKLFTWIAVMQLVEEGRLDLNADVNTWLEDFRIPATYEEPVTLEHLMTHSAGFEDRVIGLFGRDEESLAPLGEILAAQLPARVRPPGEVISYSNHGTSIAAYIVEQVTGTTLPEYVEANIFEPLGMERTTFAQPLPPALESQQSLGYRYGDQVFEPQEFEFIPLAPAGAVSSTATDMARFMMANLADGTLNDRRILQADTARRMRSDVFRHAPRLNPMGYGYLDFSLGGQWIVGHGGDTFWFHSVMALLPEHDLGFFVSVNTDEGAQAIIPFTEAFVEHFFPAEPKPPAEPAAGFEERAHRYTGHYRGNRYAHTTLAKLGALGTVEVTATPDALLLSSTGEQRWIELEPGVFRNAVSGETLVFREDEAGEITHMFVGPLQIAAFERVEGLDSPIFHRLLFGFNVGVFALTLVLWPVAAMVRRRFDVHYTRDERLPLGGRLSGWLAALLFLSFLVVAGGVLSDPTSIVYGVPQALRAALWLPLVAAFFSVATLLYMISIWKHRRAGAWTRIWYTLLAVACVASLWQLHYWNLLGFRY